jgi:hypothetical protein
MSDANEAWLWERQLAAHKREQAMRVSALIRAAAKRLYPRDPVAESPSS